MLWRCKLISVKPAVLPAACAIWLVRNFVAGSNALGCLDSWCVCPVQAAGNATFQAAPVEDFHLHVHLLKTVDAAAPTHLLVWRPVPVGDKETAADSEVMEFNVGFAASGAAAVWKLSGALPDGKEAAALPTISGTQWTMAVSSIPTLVVLA
jgi:hypothetical protein